MARQTPGTPSVFTQQTGLPDTPQSTPSQNLPIGGNSFGDISARAKTAFRDALGGISRVKEIKDPRKISGGVQDRVGAIPGIRDPLAGSDVTGARAALTRGAGDIQTLRGLGTQGISEFAKEQLDAQRLRTGRQVEAARSGAQAQSAQQQAQLAAGGLSGAASERLGRQAQRQGLFAGQAARQAGSQAEANILAGARQQQLGILGKLPGQEAGLSAQGQNIAGLGLKGDVAAGNLGIAKENLISGAEKFDVGKQLESEVQESRGDLVKRGQDIGTATTGAQLDVAPILAQAIGSSGGKK